MQCTTSMLALALSYVWYLYVECFLMGFYHGSLQIPKYHKCISYSPLKISGRLFCYQETYRNPIRLRCQSEILRRKIIICIYLNELLSVQPMILLAPISICRSYFSPIRKTRNPSVYGGADGYCPHVQPSLQIVSTNHTLFITQSLCNVNRKFVLFLQVCLSHFVENML